MIPRMLTSITGAPCSCRTDRVASSGVIVGPGPPSCTHLPETADEPRWIAAALRNEAAIRQALQDVCDCCNDIDGWRAIKAVAKLLHKEAPHRVFNIKMRLS